MELQQPTSDHSQQNAVERRLHATSRRQQRRRIRHSKAKDEGSSVRPRRSSSEYTTSGTSDRYSAEPTFETQMWDMQMQNAYLRHQLGLAERERAWLVNQLQESQAKLATLMERKGDLQHESGPQLISSKLSSSSSGSDSDLTPWGTSGAPAEGAPSAGAQQPSQLPPQHPLDDFDLFQLDLLPDVPEGLESVDSLTAHIPLGI